MSSIVRPVVDSRAWKSSRMASGQTVPLGRDSIILAWLARILPKEFVRRVAEPALADEILRWSMSGRMPPFAKARFIFSCLWVGVPRVFWDRRRPTGVTVVFGSALVVIIALLLWAQTMYQVPPATP